jgi:hypothetical protein
MLKCSRCRHIFPAERTQRGSERPPAPAKPSRTAVATAGKDLSFDFDEPAWEGEQTELPTLREEDEYSLGGGTEVEGRGGGGPSLLSDEPPPEEPFPPGTLGRASEETVSYSFDEDAEGEAENMEETEDQAEQGDGEDDEGDEEEDEDEDEEAYTYDEPVADEPMKARRRSVLPLFVFFAVVVGGYFFLAQELIRDHELAEAFTARLPLVGSSLAADRLLFRKVALNEVEGKFVRVKNDKDVFVISGTALNTASRPLRNIRVEGALLDEAGTPLRQETITCGGMDARRLLQGLSLREVEMLGKVEPPRRFRLDPGDTTSFAIVFASPPAEARDFSARVASAQR